MAKHEEKKEERREERKRGGRTEHREEHKEERKHGGRAEHRAEGGEMKPEEHEEALKVQRRRHGGRVHGEPSKHRPDRRARGGAMAGGEEPLSRAGKMDHPAFERGGEPGKDKGGKGHDRD